MSWEHQWHGDRRESPLLFYSTNLRQYSWTPNIYRASITLISKEENETWRSRRWAEGPTAEPWRALHPARGLEVATQTRHSEPIGWTGTKMPMENLQGIEALPRPLPSAPGDRGGNSAGLLPSPTLRVRCLHPPISKASFLPRRWLFIYFFNGKMSFSKCYQFQSN